LKKEFNLKFQLPENLQKCDAYQTQLNGLQAQPQKEAEAAQTQAPQIESLERQRNNIKNMLRGPETLTAYWQSRVTQTSSLSLLTSRAPYQLQD